MAAVIKIEVTTSGGLDAVKKDVSSLGDAAKESGGGFNALQEIATGALRRIGEAAINLAGSALQKLGGFLVDSISVAGDFESKMNSVSAALGKGFEPGTESLTEFKDLFISLGKELPVSTAEVQDAALALVKGGLDPAVVKAGALRDSLNFAAAAGMGLAEAAELTIKQLGTFVPIGASVEEQTRFMADAQNLLVKAAGASTLDVDQLGNAMLAAGGQARAAGLDYKEFVTTMGLISPSFGSAAEAGTSFKNFLTRLNPTTTAAKDAMSELGLMSTNTTKIMQFLSDQGIAPLGTDLDTLGNQFTELMVAQGRTAKDTEKLWSGFSQSAFFDTEGKFIGMAKASEILKGALSGLSDQQRIATLQAIFGNDAMGAATALAGAGADGFQAFADKMMAANGVQGQAQATQQGFNFQLENMKGSLEALQITIGTALLPVLASLIGDYLTPGINTLMAWADQIGPLITQFQAFVSNGQAMQGLLNTLLPYFTGLAAVILSIIVPAFYAWAAAAIPAAIATVIAMAPVILAIAAIGAAVALLTAAWINDWGGIQEKTAAVWAFIQPTFEAVVTWFQVNIPIAIQAASDFFTNTLLPALNTIWTFIQNNVLPIFATVAQWLQTTIPAATATLSSFWTGTLLPALNSVWAFIQNFVVPLFTALVQVHMAILGLAVRTLTAVWTNELLPALTKIWTYISTILGPIFQWLNVTIIQPLLQTLKDTTFFVLGGMIPFFEMLGKVLSGTVAGAFDHLSGVAGGLKGALHSIGDAVQAVISWLNDLASTINSIGVPDWLQGHSPPPMANWFGDISGAIGAVNAQLPTLAMNLAAQIGPSGQSISNTASSRSFTYAPQVTSYGGHDMPMDLALASSLAGV